MKTNIDIEITVPNQTRYLKLVGKIGENMAHELKCDTHDHETLGHHLNLVLTEALVNTIKHAKITDQKEEVHIRINVFDKDLTIRVYDNGRGFDLNTVSSRICPDPLNEQGRGIFIIRSLMDSVVYKKANGGNVLEMTKRLC